MRNSALLSAAGSCLVIGGHEDRLMHCPICDSQEIRSPTTRRDTVESIVRRRRCNQCDHNWWTVEVELPPESIRWKIDPNLDGQYRHRYPTRLPGAQRVTFS